jgi:AsmA protein
VPARPATQSPQSIEDLLKEPAATPQVRGYLSRDGWKETPLDLSGLGIFDADVRLAFGRLTSQSFNTNQGQVHVVVTGRTAKLVVDDLALHDGKVRGTFAFDAANAKPVLTIAMTLDGVALGPLLKDAGAESIDGRAKVTLNVAGMGHTERQIVDTLAGKAEISVPRGTITGYDVGAIVRGLAKMKLPRGEPDPKAKTEFTDFGAAFTITKGIADNKDFRIVTRDARAIGSGQIALGPRTIDFTVRPKLTAPVETPAGLGGPGVNLAALDLPIRITGPLAQPNVSADLQSLAANPAKALEAVDPATRREVEDTVKGVLAGDEAAKAKARDVLNRLFGR